MTAPSAPAGENEVASATAVAERVRRSRAYDPEGRYDGTSAFAAFDDAQTEEDGLARRAQVAVTLALVILPVVGVLVAGWLTWGRGLGWVEVALFLGFWAVSA